MGEVIHRVTDRDRELLALLDEHGTLTTRQITALLFNSVHTAAHRLDRLRQLDLIAAFRPQLPTGARGCNHWTLGVLGARLAAYAEEREPPQPAAVYRRQESLAASPRLRHLVGVNQFFADLTAHGRQHPAIGRLTRWWSEPHAHRAFASQIHPDGHGVWTGPDGPVGFFLEHDTGTERPLTRLTTKLHAYARLTQAGGPGWPVLFWLPSPTRERHLHRILTPPLGVIVATATHGQHPADPVWRLHGDPDTRCLISDLPQIPDTRGPLNPGLT
ncbi:replication-relaxation family protein [Actinocatenispora rupis]|uniref:Replication-relaxation n=1 Tax=Actinocatenispora rupis TaxID=519421 RepID=A0A8J3J7R9_9ACTN|nr:replication-relaxation family protein [Actinocatenispora rupis]GID13570.1 hypothetical protein Aru02nite_44590 [Actinocatenispora rupis]